MRLKRLSTKINFNTESFSSKKDVYGIVDDDGKILAMVGVSDNKQLIGAKKIYNPFYVDIDIGRKLIKCLIQELIAYNKKCYLHRLFY